ncbi:kelch-like protein 2 [Corticium candelabrum]|uniref:kelch-like protein 2 n=1 Tax=Corticium candelabrum TaxID=121492 RepID=UPI002E252CBD|nr:kelch-like protein 2 [Corticium candelabrum]
MDDESKWRPVTVLPNEQQLSCVSVALQGNFLYAVGGIASSDWKRASTAHVFDLNANRWTILEDMLTNRSGSSCVVFNDSVYVGAGWTDNAEPCHTVECLRKGSRYWEEFASYPIPMSTMTLMMLTSCQQEDRMTIIHF